MIVKLCHLSPTIILGRDSNKERGDGNKAMTTTYQRYIWTEKLPPKDYYEFYGKLYRLLLDKE